MKITKKEKEYLEDLQKFETLQKECFEIFKNKNKDYGRAYKDFSTIGLIIRINDKIKRMLNITETGIVLVNDEKLSDTMRDLANYSLIALMELDSKKKVKKVVKKVINKNKKK